MSMGIPCVHQLAEVLTLTYGSAIDKVKSFSY